MVHKGHHLDLSAHAAKGIEEQLNGLSLGGGADVLIGEATAGVLSAAMQEGTAWQEHSIGWVVWGADCLTPLLGHLTPPLGLHALGIHRGQLDQLHVYCVDRLAVSCASPRPWSVVDVILHVLGVGLLLLQGRLYNSDLVLVQVIPIRWIAVPSTHVLFLLPDGSVHLIHHPVKPTTEAEWVAVLVPGGLHPRESHQEDHGRG